MELRQLRYFVTIADLGSMSRASQALYVAQPALSKQVAKLEEDLGQPLLIRGSAGVRMTEQGEIFYLHAQRVLRMIEGIRIAVGAVETNPAGTVCIGLPQSTAAQYALPLIEESRRRYPAIRLEIFDEISSHIARCVDSGRLDFGIVVNDEDGAPLDTLPLVDEELFLISGRDQTPGLPSISAAELAALPLLVPGPGPGQGSRALLDKFLADQGAPALQQPVVVNSANIMRCAMLAGVAHAILPRGSVVEELAAGACAATPLHPKLSRRMYLCKSRNCSLSLAGRAVYDLLVAMVCERVADGRWQGMTFP